MKAIQIILVISIVLVIASCNSGSQMTIGYHEVIDDYHGAYFSKKKEKNEQENFAIYIDFSSGMKVAFDDAKTLGFYELFINSLKISKIDFFEAAINKLTRFPNMDKGKLYKIVKDKKRYNKINAPLDRAVNQIVNNGNEAVFITDGELWQDEERDDPWAREAFERWLKAGNTITFFVTDHIDAKKEKHLFYIFFIPKNRVGDEENFANQFDYYLKHSSEGKSYNFNKFTFNNNGYKFITEYPSQSSGGANINAELDPETYIKASGDNAYEFHEYLLNWEGIINYIREATDDNGNPIKGGEPLLSKLFIETTMFEFYKIKQLDIKVYDIKKDADRLVLCRECRENKPEFEMDENREKLLDSDNQPIVAVPGHADCYDDFGKLKIDTVFSASSSLVELKEVFVFDNDAFQNNMNEQGRGEVIVKVHPNFDGSQINSEDDNLHRIDIVLKSVEENTSNPNLDKFIWDGKQVSKNRSIYNSIIGALKAANPEGKVIYTYYIKTFPNDFIP